jgi:hypothetical protein
MLARTRELTEKVRAWYAAFEFHRVYHAVNDFAIVDLSSFYIDVLKDRMYTFAPTSQARRSAQTVLWQITEALSGWSRPSSASPPTKCGSICPLSKAAKPACTSRNSLQAGRSLLRRPNQAARRMEAALRSTRCGLGVA